MNAQPSFDPPEYPQRRRSPALRQPNRVVGNTVETKITSPRQKFSSGNATSQRVRSNLAYTHRRQGLEIATKLVTYSTLSLFGMVTLVHSIGYNWAQQSKLQHLETELQDAKLRTEKINSKFNHAFDPHAQKSVMQENSYKIAPDRLQIVLVSPGSDLTQERLRQQPLPKNTQGK
jgi:hypothetical protein